MLKYAQIKDALVIGIMFVKTEITDAHYIRIDNNEQVKAGYKYDSQSEPRFYLDSENEEVAPSIAPIELTNVNVTGEHVVLGAGNIWWLPINEQFTLTANAQLEDMEMMIIIERVVNGSDVIEDLRAKASIADGLITINTKFVQSGNYQITSERLNAGLEAVDAPFRLSFDKVEFDAYV
tara:strand:+ start:487 stop:1023 length:537 start_codon:yes stop_codon:yes gene_type:complete